ALCARRSELLGASPLLELFLDAQLVCVPALLFPAIGRTRGQAGIAPARRPQAQSARAWGGRTGMAGHERDAAATAGTGCTQGIPPPEAAFPITPPGRVRLLLWLSHTGATARAAGRTTSLADSGG